MLGGQAQQRLDIVRLQCDRGGVIGDGLVAQIPALFLSLATAIIVTRVTTSQSLSEQASSQLAKPLPLFVSASILLLIGIVPGMPHAVFITLSGATFGIGYLLLKRDDVEISEQAKQQTQVLPPPAKELDWNDIEQVDLIGLEIGYGLIPMVNPETGETLCIACNLCATACPEHLIVVQSERNPVTKRKEMTSFTYDVSRCMFCGLCVEACSTDCLELSQDYELAQYTRDNLVLARARLERGPEPTVYTR